MYFSTARFKSNHMVYGSAIAVISALISVAAVSAENSEHSDAVAEITRIEHGLAAAAGSPETAKHPERALKFFCDSGQMSLMEVAEPPVHRGAAAMRDTVGSMYSSYTGHVQFIDMEVTAGSDVAFVASIQRFTGKDLHSGELIDVFERVTDGFRKVGGKWCITHQHLSFPLGPEAYKAAMAQKSVNPTLK